MIPDKVRAVLEVHNLEAVEFEEGSTSTARDAAEKLGVSVGQIAKSLLFYGKNKLFFLVLCPGDRKISSSKLKAVLGVKSRMANAEETFQATGFHPGGVCPFGVEESASISIKASISTIGFTLRLETMPPGCP